MLAGLAVVAPQGVQGEMEAQDEMDPLVHRGKKDQLVTGEDQADRDEMADLVRGALLDKQGQEDHLGDKDLEAWEPLVFLDSQGIAAVQVGPVPMVGLVLRDPVEELGDQEDQDL